MLRNTPSIGPGEWLLDASAPNSFAGDTRLGGLSEASPRPCPSRAPDRSYPTASLSRPRRFAARSGTPPRTRTRRCSPFLATRLEAQRSASKRSGSWSLRPGLRDAKLGAQGDKGFPAGRKRAGRGGGEEEGVMGLRLRGSVPPRRVGLEGLGLLRGRGRRWYLGWRGREWLLLE